MAHPVYNFLPIFRLPTHPWLLYNLLRPVFSIPYSISPTVYLLSISFAPSVYRVRISDNQLPCLDECRNGEFNDKHDSITFDLQYDGNVRYDDGVLYRHYNPTLFKFLGTNISRAVRWDLHLSYSSRSFIPWPIRSQSISRTEYAGCRDESTLRDSHWRHVER